MVYASIKSREKVFHLPHCKIHTRINRDYRIAFDTPAQARSAGYRMCNCCSSMGMRLRKEQKEIDTFCEKNKLKYLLFRERSLVCASFSRKLSCATIY